ncbi:MAG TPA: chemotaxis protein CheD [Acidobacteriota bacterium]|nr:chemotaxis protein CheD [Acidobacteriota bacterium]
MNHVIGISEMKVSNKPGDALVTYSLGSCVGVTLYDPIAGVGALLHSMLPLSKIDRRKAEARPFMFVDTGVTQMLQTVFDLGAQRSRLIVKVAGCASLLDDKKLFKIGERNYTVLRKILWKNNILITAEDVGGTISRTMHLYMADGRTTIKSGGNEKVLA